METYVAALLAGAALVSYGWLWIQVRTLQDETADLRRVIAGHKHHIEKLYAEVDELGQPVEVQRPKAGPELGNQRELQDGLPLHGHLIVVGQSGSGKSNILMGQIIRRLRAGQELHCIDVKGEMEPIFGGHVKCVPTEQAKAKFEELLDIAKKRRELFAVTSQARRRPIRDYIEYEKVTGERMPIVTLLCEELIVLMSEVDEDLLVRLLVLGRSAGVFVICAAQYLKADILSRKGSVNFNTQVFLGKYDSVSIGILFGNLEREETKALKEFLGPPGRGAVCEQGRLSTRIFPEVTVDYLLPFFDKDDDDEREEAAVPVTARGQGRGDRVQGPPNPDREEE